MGAHDLPDLEAGLKDVDVVGWCYGLQKRHERRLFAGEAIHRLYGLNENVGVWASPDAIVSNPGPLPGVEFSESRTVNICNLIK